MVGGDIVLSVVLFGVGYSDDFTLLFSVNVGFWAPLWPPWAPRVLGTAD